jgi:hypothetical protein
LYRPTLINMRAIPQLTSECGANAGGALRLHCSKVEEGIPSRDQNQRPAKIGGQLALTIDNAKRDGAEISERADGSQRAGSIQWAAAEILRRHLGFSG